MTKLNLDNFRPEIQHVPYSGDPNLCASCGEEASRVGEFKEPICETCYEELLEDIKQATNSFCPECTEILGSSHWCYNCGYDPFFVDYKAGELSLADWEARYNDYSDFDFDDIPF